MQPTSTPKWLPIVAFITVSIAWGTTYGAIKLAVETIPPFLMAGVRFTFAGAVLWAVLKMRGIPSMSWPDIFKASVVGVALLSIANTSVGFAEQFIDSAFAALIVNVSPFIFLGLMVATGDRVPRLAWLGLLIGFAGLIVLVWPELRAMVFGEGDLRHPMFWWALGALILASTSWACGSFFANRKPPKANHLMIIAVQNIAGGLGALFFSTVSGEIWTAGEPSMRSIGGMIWLVVVGSWLGFVSYIYCVMHLPAHRTATTTYINNVVAVTVGVLILGEQLTSTMVIGGSTILFGVWLVNIARHKAKEAAPEITPEPAKVELENESAKK